MKDLTPFGLENFGSRTITAVAYGGGKNSAGLLCGMREWGERPDYILFSDTSGEKPETYQHIHLMNRWCLSVGFPPIIWVRYRGKYKSLEDECLGSKTLPSLAYGYKKCSQKWKRGPQEIELNNHQAFKAFWSYGLKVQKLIGYDVTEDHRTGIVEDEKYTYRYPLVEQEWDRQDCDAAILRAGLPLPPKSSCYFCPAMKKQEIQDLDNKHPELAARALAIEANAKENLITVKGLGRNFAWADYLATPSLFKDFLPMPVMKCFDCHDGA